MKLAMFGSTGTVGRVLLDQALTAGHEVHALARTPSKLEGTDKRCVVFEGNAKDPAAVAATLAGCTAVLSTLGGFSDPDSIRIGTDTILAAMPEAGIRRLVVVQGFHLDFPGDPQNLGRKLIVPVLWLGSRDLIGDSRAMARSLQASDVDWTVVRVPRVIVGPRTGTYRTGQFKLGPWSSVSSGDVADALLGCLLDRATFGTAPMVASRRGASAAVNNAQAQAQL